VLQCVVVCCSVLQRVVECCSVLHMCCSGSASLCSLPKLFGLKISVFVPVCCGVLLCVAACSSVLQCVEVCYNVLQWQCVAF